MTISPAGNESAIAQLTTIEFAFARFSKGYDTDQVDAFLEKVDFEVKTLRDQLRNSQDRLRQAAEYAAGLEAKLREASAAAPLAPATPAAPVPVAAVAVSPADEAEVVSATQKTLLMAQRFVEQTEREARDAAARKIAEAEETARKITVEAELKVREEVSRLEGVKGQLVHEIDGLSSQLDSERIRLTSQLREVLSWIDTHVKPSEQVRAIRSIDAPTQAVPTTPVAETGEAPGQIFDYGNSETSV